MTAPRVTAPPDVEQAAHAHAGHGGEQTVVAPMPGTVLAVLVAAGDAVQPRQPLVVLEAMKMEHPVASPFEGVVKAVRVDPGDRVAGGQCSSSSRVRRYAVARSATQPAVRFTSQTTITTPT